ncbi:MAG: serine hydrolase [Pseudomonadota bacterium]
MRVRKLTQAAFASLLALLGLTVAATAQNTTIAEGGSPSPSAAIVRLFTETPIRAEWFTPEFATAVTPPQVQSIIDDLVRDYGAFVSAEIEGRAGVIRLERALIPTQITLDGAGRIAGLLLQPPQLTGADVGDITNDILGAALGDVAVMAAEHNADGTWRMLAAHRTDAPMAVGSAFKLAVLRAYEDAIADGALARDDVVPLAPEDRSLPSGVLQDMQAGVPITLEALAGLMIQQSDNTATDALMRVVGREAIEALSPRNQPFLTTAELFKLISIDGDAARAAFAAGDVGEKRRVLDDLAAVPLPAARDIGGRATWAEAEWMFTAHELCDLLVSLRDAPALGGAANPIVAAEGWRWIGFKGGSEYGVLNLSAAGVTPDGRTVCAVVTANASEAQPETRIGFLFGSLFRSLANA